MSAAKILIVEDELISAYDLSDNLERLGYTVVAIVDSGEAAIAQVRENPPDMILMDIKLRGEMNGIEAAAQIKEYNIPVIYLTAFSDESTLKAATKTMPYGYLTKPAKPEDIRTTIAIALSKHQEDVRVRETIAEEKRLNELKSRFLAMIAHDLRSPLTTILTSLDILQHYDLKLTEARKSKHYGRIKTAIEEMTGQLEELLAGEQAESGKLAFLPEPINAIAFCQELVEQFQPRAVENKCHLSFTSDCNCDPIDLDRNLLRHILTNLLSNAIKYSPSGGIISVNFTCDRDSVIFRIQDCGIGIPSEHLQKLFHPFERANNVGKIKGTGMGLYIVNQAVRRHQGYIHVESKMGTGTTFTVTLPAVKSSP